MKTNELRHFNVQKRSFGTFGKTYEIVAENGSIDVIVRLSGRIRLLNWVFYFFFPLLLLPLFASLPSRIDSFQSLPSDLIENWNSPQLFLLTVFLFILTITFLYVFVGIRRLTYQGQDESPLGEIKGNFFFHKMENFRRTWTNRFTT